MNALERISFFIEVIQIANNRIQKAKEFLNHKNPITQNAVSGYH